MREDSIKLLAHEIIEHGFSEPIEDISVDAVANGISHLLDQGIITEDLIIQSAILPHLKRGRMQGALTNA